jgi:hypothetical protein
VRGEDSEDARAPTDRAVSPSIRGSLPQAGGVGLGAANEQMLQRPSHQVHTCTHPLFSLHGLTLQVLGPMRINMHPCRSTHHKNNTRDQMRMTPHVAALAICGFPSVRHELTPMLVRSHSASTPRHAILDAHHASHALVLPFGRSQHSSSVYGRNEADVDMPECADARGIGQPWVSHALYNALSSPAVSASSGSTEVCPRACVRANMYFSSNTPRLISSTKTIALLVEESKSSKRLDSGRRLSVLATMPAKRVFRSRRKNVAV